MTTVLRAIRAGGRADGNVARTGPRGVGIMLGPIHALTRRTVVLVAPLHGQGAPRACAADTDISVRAWQQEDAAKSLWTP